MADIKMLKLRASIRLASRNRPSISERVMGNPSFATRKEILDAIKRYKSKVEGDE